MTQSITGLKSIIFFIAGLLSKGRPIPNVTVTTER